MVTQSAMDAQKLSGFALLKVFVYTLLLFPASIVMHTISTLFGFLITIILIPTSTYDIIYKFEKAKLVIKEKAKNGTL
jgi:NADH:ubiquinone oxidoreductase subunit 3 (subunit A)